MNKSNWGGDFDDDDNVAMDLWAVANQGTYKVRAWYTSPRGLEEEAKRMNAAGFSSANRGAGKHSNPPAMPTALRDT